MADKTITTTSTGTTVILREHEFDGAPAHVIILDNPAAPADLQGIEAGLILDGGFMSAPFLPIAMSPEVLRAIADAVAETAEEA